jgi:hypothetical protein
LWYLPFLLFHYFFLLLWDHDDNRSAYKLDRHNAMGPVCIPRKKLQKTILETKIFLE